MGIHPISLALNYLKGKRKIHMARFHGKPAFASEKDAVDTLRRLTGRDFGADPAKWGKWLRRNRWVYHAGPNDPRITKVDQ